MSAGRSSTGMEGNVAAAIAVAFGWISGLIFLLIEKDSAFVRFYAIQSLLVSALYIACAVLSLFGGMLPGTGLPNLLPLVLGLLPFIIWIVLLIRAFQGVVWEIPIVGSFARRQAGLS